MMINVRLYLPKTDGNLPLEEVVEHLQGNNGTVQKLESGDQTKNDYLVNDRRSQKQWDTLCAKWGMTVVRTMKYVQREFWDYPPQTNDIQQQHYNINNDSDSAYEVIDGCRVEKLHDHLVISQLGSSSLDKDSLPAQLAGLKVCDIIQEVNGIVNPSLKTLFDVMKGSFIIQ